MRSIEAYGLPISRAIFTQGEAPYEYIDALSMSLFLSGQEESVRDAMAAGFPAGLVVNSARSERDDDIVRVALDFDGVIASDGPTGPWLTRIRPVPPGDWVQRPSIRTASSANQRKNSAP